MKRFFIAITCLLIVVNSQKVSAGGAGGGSLEITQNLNRIILLAQKISSQATALNTQYDMIKNTILDPIANGLIAVSLQTSSDNILSWVNGGMDGNPLIISNPEQYIKNEGLREVRKALATIPQDGAFSGSIFNSLVGAYKDTSVAERLGEQSKSGLPTEVQETMCTDEKLTSLANERATDNDGILDQETALVEKEYLYGYACSCDPQNDADCATKLMDLYAQRPSLGGSRAWLRLTSGDNAAVKTMQAQNIIRAEVEKQKDLAIKELFNGLGTISEKKCIREETDLTGGTFCAEQAVLTPGKAVQSGLNLASTVGVDRLANCQGSGCISSLLTGFLDRTLFKGLNQGLASLTGGSSNVSQTTNSSVPLKQDLAGDPDKKTELVSTIMKQIDFHSTTVANLEAIDSNYLSAIAVFENKITRVRSCFSNLVSSGIASGGDSRVTAAYDYYNDRKNRIDATKSLLAEDATKINAARQLIADTTSKLNSSQSSQEISNIFNTYSKNYTSQGLPTSSMEAQREQDRARDEHEASNDTAGDSHLDTCSQIERSYWWDTQNSGNYY